MNVIVIDHQHCIKQIIEEDSVLFDRQGLMIRYLSQFSAFEKMAEEMRPSIVLINLQVPSREEYLDYFSNELYPVLAIHRKSNFLSKVINSCSNCSSIQLPLTAVDLSIEINELIARFAKNANGQVLNGDAQIGANHRIAVSSAKKIVFVEVNDIVFCKASRQYTEINLSCGKMILSSRTLSYFEKKLTVNHFMRIHRSYLVNLNYVNEFHRHNDELLLSNNNSIKLSYNMKEDFLSRMDV